MLWLSLMRVCTNVQVIINMPIDNAVKAKDLVYKLSPSCITLGIQGKEPVLDGEFYGGNKVKVDDSNWEIENVAHLGRCCVVTLMYVKLIVVFHFCPSLFVAFPISAPLQLSLALVACSHSPHSFPSLPPSLPPPTPLSPCICKDM
jgi:hypothetical protein